MPTTFITKDKETTLRYNKFSLIYILATNKHTPGNLFINLISFYIKDTRILLLLLRYYAIKMNFSYHSFPNTTELNHCNEI